MKQNTFHYRYHSFLCAVIHLGYKEVDLINEQQMFYISNFSQETLCIQILWNFSSSRERTHNYTESRLYRHQLTVAVPWSPQAAPCIPNMSHAPLPHVLMRKKGTYTNKIKIETRNYDFFFKEKPISIFVARICNIDDTGLRKMNIVYSNGQLSVMNQRILPIWRDSQFLWVTSTSEVKLDQFRHY